MRLAFLSQNACQGDAVGDQLRGKVQASRAAGHEVRLFLSHDGRLHSDLAEHSFVGSAHELWRSPREKEYLLEADRIHVEYAGDYDLLTLLPNLARRAKCITFDYHGVTPSHLWSPGGQASSSVAAEHRCLVWCAQGAIVHSRFASRELHEATGYPLDRIHRLPCFIPDEGSTAHCSLPRHDVRGPLGLSQARVLLFVGRLAANKRIPTAIQALAACRDEPPPLHLVLIGPQSDIYAMEKEACARLARQLGVDERVHFLGSVSGSVLSSWYRSADALILPSSHECFGLPVLEAMRHGLPVIASRAGALPETVGSAGLTFHTDDVDDLVRQWRRIEAPPMRRRSEDQFNVAVVAPRWGAKIVGGAEASIRKMALSLQRAGHAVEVFTTCAKQAGPWRNELPPQTLHEDGLLVHRLPLDAHDAERHDAIHERLRRRETLSPAEEEDYLTHSVNSRAILQQLTERTEEWDAILVGPYLYGLTHQVAEHFRDRVLLVPCFHDEPLAYLQCFQRTYASVGGILFHTRAEQSFTEAILGINHPRAMILGTHLSSPVGQGQKAQVPPELGREYVVYCGRYCAEKGLDRLIEYGRRYAQEHPRFRLVCIGQGSMPLPKEPWLVNFGWVSDADKQDILAGAKALVQLSPHESLSLVLLEAWAEGTPVVGWRGCEVVVDQIEQADGGWLVHDFASFARAMDAIWSDEQLRRQKGEAGRRFVQEHYLDADRYQAKLTMAMQSLYQPLRGQMIAKGYERADAFTYAKWSPRWLRLIAEQHHAPLFDRRCELHFEALIQPIRWWVGSGDHVMALAVTNRGQVPWVGKGAFRDSLWSQVFSEEGRPVEKARQVEWDRCLCPGQRDVLLLPVKVPRDPGSYRLSITWRDHAGRAAMYSQTIPVEVAATQQAISGGEVLELIDLARQSLVLAHEQAKLPDEYVDITEGSFAPLKKWVKRKILHNFRKAYVDVISRQQSRFNEQVMKVLQQLMDSLTTIQHGVYQPVPSRDEWKRWRQKHARLKARVRRLTERLEALEMELADVKGR